MKAQKGFTLIELVVVIVILGILAAVAAPKFIDISSDAREATLEGVKGAMKSGNDLVYSKAIIAGQESAATYDVDADGNAVASGGTAAVTLEFGYVPETVAGVEFLLDDNSDWTAVAATGFARVFPEGITTSVAATASVPATSQCYLEYQEATATTKPTYTVVGDGC
ncbi:type II secretion system protein [uncultured Ferrimonas sp.]|uniref:type II secretion system protein n=1 Tax=uncultured Ferrimonas sp. TaxID=432640 RepID=UPI002616FCA2|nr:type II secretion system protein [uncultured Ferrimonas sp.]